MPSAEKSQVFAWIVALSASSAIFAGSGYYLHKKSGHGHDEHAEDSGHGGDHVAHHDGGHGDEHGSDHGGGHGDKAAHDGDKGHDDGHGHGDKHDEEKHGDGHDKGHDDGHADKGDGHGKGHDDGHGHGDKPAHGGDKGHDDDHGHGDKAAHGGDKGHDDDHGHGDKAAHGDGHGAKSEAKAEKGHGDKHDDDHGHGDKHEEKSHDKKSEESHAKPSTKHSDAAKGSAKVCEQGRQQSPVNITGAKLNTHLPHVTFNYGPMNYVLEHDGKTIQATPSKKTNHLMIDKERYTLVGFHFHNPSEHRLEGVPAPMEMHLEHEGPHGKAAMVGIMVEEKPQFTHPGLKGMWAQLPRAPNEKSRKAISIDLAEVLPKQHQQFFHYRGSLDPPSCAENVDWFVLRAPIMLGGAQVDLYASIFPEGSARPVQPTLGRVISFNTTAADVAH